MSEGSNGSGRFDLAGKLALLDSVDVLSVPTVYQEAKGIYVLEAWARGVPVVQPNHGSFPELIEMTGAGLLVPPNDPVRGGRVASLLARVPGQPAPVGRCTAHHLERGEEGWFGFLDTNPRITPLIKDVVVEAVV